MDDKKLVRIACSVVLAPVVVGLAGFILKSIYNGGVLVYNYINKKKFNKRIAKGLKDGSIVQIDGAYYQVQDVEEA